MKTFKVETSEIELHYLTAFYEVDAETEEEAKQLVLKGNGDFIDSRGGDYEMITKDFAKRILSGEEEAIQITGIEDTATEKENNLKAEREILELQIQTLQSKLNALNK